jgi:hypothetical protein
VPSERFASPAVGYEATSRVNQIPNYCFCLQGSIDLEELRLKMKAVGPLECMRLPWQHFILIKLIHQPHRCLEFQSNIALCECIIWLSVGLLSVLNEVYSVRGYFSFFPYEGLTACTEEYVEFDSNLLCAVRIFLPSWIYDYWQQSPFEKPVVLQLVYKLFALYKTRKFHSRVHNSPPAVPNLIHELFVN